MTVAAIWVSKRNFTQDLSHRYVVFIDGEAVGTVAPYRTGQFEVRPGWHRVWARLPDTGDTAMGDVVINVKPGQVRRVRTTSRLKRLPFRDLLRALGEVDYSPRFPVKLSPSVLLRPWPTSEDDRNPPPDVARPLTDGIRSTVGADPKSSELADRIRKATFN